MYINIGMYKINSGKEADAYEKLLEQKVEKPFLRKPWIPTEGKEGEL